MLKIKLLAFPDAPDSLYEHGIARIEKLISGGKYELAEGNPDILFFLSGGSERLAIDQVSAGSFYLLIGSQHDNSYASATEVKAWLNDRNIHSVLLDDEAPGTGEYLGSFNTVKQALHNLQGKRLGLIGQVSDWLVSSAISSELLESKLGIRLLIIPWNEIPAFSGFQEPPAFSESFPGKNPEELTDTAKVSAMLGYVIDKWQLDAITVECFPMVRKDSVTACLPLAKFNKDGIPAGCEGDLTAIAGMMLCRELTGIIPWIANVNKVSEEACLFSHCTIAPGLVSGFSVTTHFETGKGTAIEGEFKEDQLTVFRFDNRLSKAFIATGTVTGRPKLPTACRTQIEVKLPPEDVKLLKQSPLGNHHLIFPGDCVHLIKMACDLLGMVQVGSEA
jgi:L-fucose isomerase-like protein